jgi:hypothetical protein
LEAPAALAGIRGDALEAPAAKELPPLGAPGPRAANPVSPGENAHGPSGNRGPPCASHLPPSVSMLARSVSVATLSAHHAIPRGIESARDVIPDEGGATVRASRADAAERVARRPSWTRERDITAGEHGATVRVIATTDHRSGGTRGDCGCTPRDVKHAGRQFRTTLRGHVPRSRDISETPGGP